MAFVIDFSQIFRDCRQILLLILNEFKRINELLFPMKSSENLWFSVGLSENRLKVYEFA